jgi:dihydrofolate reductase
MTQEHSSRLIESVLVSLNGVISKPHTWVAHHFGDQSAAQSLASLRRSDAMLMGRGTYNVFAELWPNGSGEYADYLNAMQKYVFSTTLTEPTWNNTAVIAGDVVKEVSALKRNAQRDLAVYGYGQFGQTLCDAGLVDELNIITIPVFVSDGRPFFRAGARSQEWTLVSTTEGEAGTVRSTYRPAASAD